MKFPLARPLFPDVEITPADAKALVQLAEEFMDKFQLDEQIFRIDNASQVDENRWKLTRKTENIFVYSERASRLSISSDDSLGDEQAGRLIPPFLVTGKVRGTLDDMLYGMMTPSRESELINTSYADDSYADVELLRTIRSPSLEEPFSHLTIKWSVTATHASIIAPRDFVYLDTVGTRILPNGERIGYRFTHSINLRGAGPLTNRGIIRGNLSIIGIFRETPNNEVQVYGRAFFEPGGSIPRKIFAYVISMQVAGVAAQLHSGQLKKLALAMRQMDARTWIIAVPANESAIERNECGVCMKMPSFLNKSRSQCTLCNRKLCKSCRVRKLLSFMNKDYSIKKLRVTFCGFCVQQAISVPSTFVTTEEFLSGQDDFYRVPDCCNGDNVTTWKNFLSV